MVLYFIGLVWNVWILFWTKKQVRGWNKIPKLILVMNSLNIVAMFSHEILFAFFISDPTLKNNKNADYLNLLKQFNNILLLVSMNIALNNWTSYNFQVEMQV